MWIVEDPMISIETPLLFRSLLEGNIHIAEKGAAKSFQNHLMEKVMGFHDDQLVQILKYT